MSTNRSGTGTGFGEWLASEIDRTGLSRTEFAQKVGVAKSTVSRWIAGDQPKGQHIDAIADVLVLDYDLVATKAGYRPRELLQIDPTSPTAQLMPLIEKIDWDRYPDRLESLKMELRWMIERDREAKKR